MLLMTHGLRRNGPDPGHTPEGLGQIRNIIAGLDDSVVREIVVGTGLRFRQMLPELLAGRRLPLSTKVTFSSLCGGCEGYDADTNTIVFTDGATCKLEEYIGLGDRSFSPWGFVSQFPYETLFLSGGELLLALDPTVVHKKGALYRLDQVAQTCHLVAEG